MSKESLDPRAHLEATAQTFAAGPKRPSLGALVLILGLAVSVTACGQKSDEAAQAPTTETPSDEAQGQAPEAPQPEVDPLEGTRTHLDLLRLAHLADVEDQGLIIDFGTPASAKYTMGRWSNDWAKNVTKDKVSVTRLGSVGKIFLPGTTGLGLPDGTGEAEVMLRVRQVASGAKLVAYLNGETLGTLDVGSDFATQRLALPMNLLKSGENVLMLRGTKTTPLDGSNVSVELDYLAVRAQGAGDKAREPRFPTVVGAAEAASLHLPAGVTMHYHVQVPTSAKLAMKITSTAKVTASLTDTEGKTQPLFTSAAKSEGAFAAADLGPYAGKVVRLTLKADGEAKIEAAQLAVPKPEQEAGDTKAKNVVVLTIDTLRASKLKAFNPQSRVKTPAFDAFASDAAIFTSAQSPENWTKPSVASILTSLSPMSHRTKFDGSKLPDDALMLSEIYKSGGFKTATFLANGYVSDKFGFKQGWDFYTNYIRENRSTEAGNVFKEAGEWINKHKDERFFVYIQTIDPHVPYDPPDSFLKMYDATEYTGPVRPRMTGNQLADAKKNPPKITFNAADKARLEALHDGEISYHDAEFAKFVENLQAWNLFDDMVFVITSDHGEEFDEHGSWGHGHSIYQELLNVPLAVRFPAMEAAGLRVADTVSTMDIAPTVLEASGVAIPEVFEGKSLLGYLRGMPPVGPAVAFSDFLDDRRVIRAGRYKLVYRANLTATLFDLEKDPGEKHDIDPSTAEPVGLRYARTLLGQYLGAEDRRVWLYGGEGSTSNALPTQTADMDPETCEQLRQLGYVEACGDDS